jgi:hypothetical protein
MPGSGPGDGLFAGTCQLGGGIETDGFQQTVASLLAAVVHLNKGFVDEQAELVEHLVGCDGCGGAHGDVCVVAEVSGEDGQATEYDLFHLGEQVVRPIDGCFQRVLARQGGTGRPGEYVEALVETGGDLGGGEHSDSGGCQFDGQGDAVETAADVGDGRRVGLGEGEAGSCAAGPVYEQLDRLAGCQPVNVGWTAAPARVTVGHRQGGNPPGDLSGQVQRLPAGGQDAKGWA